MVQRKTLASVGVAVGAWLIALGISILGGPAWIGWTALVLGCGFFITAALWWAQSSLLERPLVEAHEAARRRQGQILQRLHLEYLNSAEDLPELGSDPSPVLPKDWVERRLCQMGEKWRRAEYKVPPY